MYLKLSMMCLCLTLSISAEAKKDSTKKSASRGIASSEFDGLVIGLGRQYNYVKNLSKTGAADYKNSMSGIVFSVLEKLTQYETNSSDNSGIKILGGGEHEPAYGLEKFGKSEYSDGYKYYANHSYQKMTVYKTNEGSAASVKVSLQVLEDRSRPVQVDAEAAEANSGGKFLVAIPRQPIAKMSLDETDKTTIKFSHSHGPGELFMDPSGESATFTIDFYGFDVKNNSIAQKPLRSIEIMLKGINLNNESKAQPPPIPKVTQICSGEVLVQTSMDAGPQKIPDDPICINY